MKSLFASLVLAVAPSLVLAQAPAAQPAKPAASPAAKAAAKPVRPAAKPRVNPELQQAVEVNTPLEDPDPNVKLSEADLAVAAEVEAVAVEDERGARAGRRELGPGGLARARRRCGSQGWAPGRGVRRRRGSPGTRQRAYRRESGPLDPGKGLCCRVHNSPLVMLRTTPLP